VYRDAEPEVEKEEERGKERGINSGLKNSNHGSGKAGSGWKKMTALRGRMRAKNIAVQLALRSRQR